MTHSDEINAVEASIKHSNELVELGAALARLRANRDFNKVIGNGYFKDEAIRLVHLKGDPSMQSAPSQASIITQMDSIAALSQYLHLIGFYANSALRAIADDEATLTELRAERNL